LLGLGLSEQLEGLCGGFAAVFDPRVHMREDVGCVFASASNC
jgi:hypothetical protein